MKTSLKYLTVFLFFIPVCLNSQLVINLPSTIEIYIAKNRLPLSTGWFDSLRKESTAGKIHYKITSIEATEHQARVRLSIPQVFSLPRVIYQVIFYYSLLSTENDRIRDKLLIYPYFSDIAGQPHITCTYQPGGKFYFTLSQWTVVPVPPAPDLQQRNIFNQILADLLENYQIMEGENQEVLQNIAEINKMPVDEVKKIYENTILWQEAQ